MKKANKIPFMVRQGDVALELIPSLPSNLKTRKNPVLALGEVSGHGHIVFGAEVMEDSDGNLFLTVEEEAELKHLLVASGVWTNEHHPVTLPAGKYRVIQQVQYDPYLKATERVLD